MHPAVASLLAAIDRGEITPANAAGAIELAGGLSLVKLVDAVITPSTLRYVRV